MMENKTKGDRGKKERAKRFVRDVLVSEFRQKADEDTIDIVADKVLRSLPNGTKGRQARSVASVQRTEAEP